ncbi:hypothetical protein LTR82_006427 [Friedmanniomyces endolithicus]|uniref:BTB domain-containing protein n=1 Tax=Friedmanniomyces endolithicus TaxID=329885 RepID=A0AAN6JA33_9PEZI|nr:hypothetical protein LTR82_006427 [Friedmanniomyces endolithicus]
MSGRPLYDLNWGVALPNTEFPQFRDGDLKIFISSTRQYHLHSSVLSNASARLDDLLDEEGPVALANAALKQGRTIKYRLDLASNPDYKDDDKVVQYILKPVRLDSWGEPDRLPRYLIDLENAKSVNPTHAAYTAVLGAFYQVPVDLGNFSTDALGTILTKTFDIIKVAEYLGCVGIITSPIEATLLATGQNLFKSIAKEPLGWLDFAFRIHSRILFREAMIHAAGQYNTAYVQQGLPTVNPAIAEVLTKKATKLKDAVKGSMQRMLSYYPTALQREITVGRCDIDKIGRASYGNDILHWLALVSFCHWATHQIADDQTHHAADFGKSVVDVVMLGADAYLSRPEMDDWHVFFPMSPRSKSVILERLDGIKATVKQFVRVLTANESQLNTDATPVEHFTCSTVNVADYPWEGDDAARGERVSTETVPEVGEGEEEALVEEEVEEEAEEGDEWGREVDEWEGGEMMEVDEAREEIERLSEAGEDLYGMS